MYNRRSRVVLLYTYTMLILSIFHSLQSIGVNIDIRYSKACSNSVKFHIKIRFAIVAEVYRVSKYYADPLTFALKI